MAQNVAAAAIVAGFGWYLWRNRGLFGSVLLVSWSDLASIGLGVVLGWLASSAQSFLLFRAEGLRIGFRENFLLTVAGILANHLPLRVGTLVRMRYLNAVHGLRYARSVSIAGIRLVLLVTATGLLGLAGTLGIWWSGGRLSVELSLVFGVVLLLACLASLRPPPLSRRRGRLFRVWNDFSSGFAAMRERPWVTAQVLGLVLVQLLVMAWRFYLTLRAVSFEASATLLAVLAPATTLSSFVSVVPGDLGFREAVMGYVTLATGFSFNTGLFAGSVDRAVLLVLVLTVGSAGFFFVYSRTAGSDVSRPGDARS